MKERKYKNDYIETERKTRVKMYKAGKHWVSSLMSHIGLTKIFKGMTDKQVIVSQEILQEDDSDTLLDKKTEKLIKGAAAAGTLASGIFITQGLASADEVSKALEMQTDRSNVLANAETVTLDAESTSTTEVDSGSLSNSGSVSTSTSESTSASISVSSSESASLSTSLSVSGSTSLSTSNSTTTSERESTSSESQVSSTSESTSESVKSGVSLAVSSENATNSVVSENDPASSIGETNDQVINTKTLQYEYPSDYR